MKIIQFIKKNIYTHKNKNKIFMFQNLLKTRCTHNMRKT